MIECLYRKRFWDKAYRSMGLARVNQYNPALAAEYYAAKYAAKQLGNIWLGGEEVLKGGRGFVRLCFAHRSLPLKTGTTESI